MLQLERLTILAITFYVVRFTQNAFGTNCYTEKLDGAYPNFPQVKVEGVKTHIELPLLVLQETFQNPN